MPTLYVVTGAGPVGWTVAEQLAEQGHEVRVLTRSGSGPEHARIERRRTDVSDPAQLGGAFAGAAAVFHCIHGSAYSAKAWRAELPRAEQAVMDAAAAAGAVVVFPESLYSYSEPDGPITESSPRDASGGKRGVRTELLRARQAHRADTVSVVAGDFFGPRVLMAHAGERLVPRVLEGKAVQAMGSAAQPHSFTYVPDLAAAMIRAAQLPELRNQVLHAPSNAPLTMRELATVLASAAGKPAPRVGAIPGWVVRGLGLFSADMRELAEMLYQFERPFVMDSSASQAKLGLEPTPLAEAAAATVGWWLSGNRRACPSRQQMSLEGSKRHQMLLSRAGFDGGWSPVTRRPVRE
ncbi:NAD-dependent epimerase/dehydratase family protein [Arthrobacter cavernae]|uniref:NAD-dependent epimerase/dehydratase family protein n=1 Tax=Arthrobacter cavernae TaxID=2817681 RepID=A0A939HGB2_9MICC|nr:NAD-dependent epimerase/dehydratase family protein [Arthrobacter cavernae]MBO1267910.1 NAD-dependent epimerase/dehydratase family protein [Arthrobacter cavernae]